MTRRINVSPRMRSTPFVAGLEERLGSKLIFTDHPGSVSAGYLKADSVRQNGIYKHYEKISHHLAEAFRAAMNQYRDEGTSEGGTGVLSD